MLNWALRYSAVLRLLEAAPGELVLDVGSGDHGLTFYAPELRVVCTDLAMPAVPPACPFVAADVTRLPFADGAFAAVVCLDLMEHLPAPLRTPALGELSRVASDQVVVGYPEGQWARRADSFLRGALTTLRRRPPPWLLEHRELQADMRLVPPDGWLVHQAARNENVFLHNLVLLAEETAVGSRLLRRYDTRRPKAGWADVRPTYRQLMDLRRR